MIRLGQASHWVYEHTFKKGETLHLLLNIELKGSDIRHTFVVINKVGKPIPGSVMTTYIHSEEKIDVKEVRY